MKETYETNLKETEILKLVSKTSIGVLNRSRLGFIEKYRYF